jgi:NUMOD4 motif/HNH endonuclease
MLPLSSDMFIKNKKTLTGFGHMCRACELKRRRDNLQEKQNPIIFLKDEIWKDIIGLESEYAISNKGRVLSKKRLSEKTFKNGLHFTYTITEKILIPSLGKAKQSYYMVFLYKKGKFTSAKVHLLVGLYFVDNPLKKPIINHKDGNKLNNNDWNLEWVTTQENVDHAWATGLNIPLIGESNPRAILTKELVLEIRKLPNAKWDTCLPVSEKYGVSVSTIKAILYRRIWKHI